MTIGIMMHAIPGAGKTTATAELIRKYNAVVVSRDALREDFFVEHVNSDGTYPFWVEKKVTELQHHIIREVIKNGRSIIVDDTNLNIRTVNQLSKLFLNLGVNVHDYFVDVTLATAVKRNNLRANNGGRNVPSTVIEKMHQAAYLKNGHIANMVRDNVTGNYQRTATTPPDEAVISGDAVDAKTIENNGSLYTLSKNLAYQVAGL